MKRCFFRIISLLFVLHTFLFISCENFITGSQTRQQVDKMIRDANAPETQIYLLADKNAGVLSPDGLVSCKLEKSISLVYTPSYGYKFYGWKVIDRVSGQALSDVIEFEDITKPETKITVKKDIQNIQIIPICYELPSVVSFSPEYTESGVYVNMPVEIEFSVPLINDDGTTIDISFGNFNVYSCGENINSCFYEPQLSQDNKTVIIRPNPIELQKFINDRKSDSLDILVKFDKEKIRIIKDGFVLPYFEKPEISLVYCCSKNIENNPPVETSGFCTKEELTVQNYTTIDASKKMPQEGTVPTEFNDKETIISHRIKDTVYIHAGFSDAESGIKSIMVIEKALYDKSGAALISDNIIKTIYKPQNLQLIKYDNNNIEFILEYKLSSEDGCVGLELYAVDYCDNMSKPLSYRFIKDTFVDIESVYPFNYALQTSNIQAVRTFEGTIENEELKSIKICNISDFEDTSQFSYLGHLPGKYLKESPYKEIDLGPECLQVQCRYKSANGTIPVPMDFISKSDNYKYWNTVLDVESINALEFTIILTDDLGNSAEKTFKFPGKTEKNQFYFFSGSRIQIGIESNSTWTNIVRFNDNIYRTGDIYIPQGTIDYYREFQEYCLINENNNHSLLVGEINKFNFDPDTLDFEMNDLDGYDEYKELVNPIDFYYTRGEPSSSKILTTIKFNPLLWNFWDELIVYIGDSKDRYLPMYLKKGSDTITFEENVTARNFKYSDKGYTIWALQKVSETINDSGEITSLKINMYSTGFKPDNPIPMENYTVAPTIHAQPVFMQGKIDGHIPKFEDYNYYTNYFSPALVQSITPIEYIKCWHKESGEEITCDRMYNYGNFHFFIIPVWDFYQSGAICFQAKDIYGNYTQVYEIYSDQLRKQPIPKIKTIQKVESEDNRYKLIFENSAEADGYSFVMTVDNEKHEWNKGLYYGYTTFRKNDTYLDSLNTPQNTFVKIYTCITKHFDSSFEEFPVFDTPIYFYTDNSVTNENCFGYLIDDNNGITIISDHKVLVHTMTTSCPLEACQNWDINEWLTFHKDLNPTILEFDPQNITPQKYTVDTSSLEPGTNYVVIAHFADGHTDMSAVMTK